MAKKFQYLKMAILHIKDKTPKYRISIFGGFKYQIYRVIMISIKGFLKP
jgi:hypothetical protein